MIKFEKTYNDVIIFKWSVKIGKNKEVKQIQNYNTYTIRYSLHSNCILLGNAYSI